MRAIAAELNQRGIPTALGTGKWSKTQVERVMSRHEELKKFRLGPGAANARIASERAAAIAPIIAEIQQPAPRHCALSSPNSLSAAFLLHEAPEVVSQSSRARYVASRG